MGSIIPQTYKMFKSEVVNYSPAIIKSSQSPGNYLIRAGNEILIGLGLQIAGYLIIDMIIKQNAEQLAGG